MPGFQMPGRVGAPRSPSMTALGNPGGGPYGATAGASTPGTAQFAPGPYGIPQTFKPGGTGIGTASTAGSWQTIPPPDFRTPEQIQSEQLANESSRERLQQQRDATAAARMNVQMGGGVPTTSRSPASAGVLGPTPSLAQIKTGMNSLQPQLPPMPSMPDTPPPIAAPTPADNSAANASAYGRAKDSIALENAAATRGLEANLTGRNMSGAGIENQNRRAMTRASLTELGNVSRQQAGADVDRADTFSKLGYEGGLQQRGQDINAQLAKFQAMLSGRGQDINARPNPLGYIGPLTALSQAGGRV